MAALLEKVEAGLPKAPTDLATVLQQVQLEPQVCAWGQIRAWGACPCSLFLSLSLMAQRQLLLAMGASPNAATVTWCVDWFLHRSLSWVAYMFDSRLGDNCLCLRWGGGQGAGRDTVGALGGGGGKRGGIMRKKMHTW